MEQSLVSSGSVSSPPESRQRDRSVDNLKVALVIGVIVGHTTMAWTGMGTWVFDEPMVREPLLTIASMLALLGGLFGMAMFFFIAGMYTAPSLARKGAGKFLVDRAIRLGVPMLFFMFLLSPVVEYVDPDAAGWDQGFWAFTLHIWWPPVPGPTWFLGILLLFSAVYAVVRTMRPRQLGDDPPLRPRHLVTAALIVALSSYLVRIAIPLGDEVWHLALAQAPAWAVGFALGVLGAERRWFKPIPPHMVAAARRAAWVAITALLLVGILASSLDRFSGGATWESMLAAVIEAILVVTMPLWLLSIFRRRFDRQGPLGRKMSRSAFAAYVLHQLVLVGLVLASHYTPWAPEVEYLLVSGLGVAVSFLLGWWLTRLPGVSRVV
jgi:glucans biosynthesis protein C